MIIQLPWNKRRESQVQQETEILVFSFKITCTHTPASFLFLLFYQCYNFTGKGKRKAICFLRFILWDVWALKWPSGTFEHFNFDPVLHLQPEKKDNFVSVIVWCHLTGFIMLICSFLFLFFSLQVWHLTENIKTWVLFL